MAVDPSFTADITWPEPELMEWDLSNQKSFKSSRSNQTESPLQNAKIVLVGSTPTLDVFVEENLYNTNYDDRELYPFDGYAVKIDATITD